ncbi:MAG: ATP-binding cassette domain-containing protein [Clostridiales Family XIII bacterium]|jgi:ABC-2 type transport system ATP-binding protein|nr:ATP-binding cassette domain-containing protein [Clostridiales Family XIII bacterium]
MSDYILKLENLTKEYAGQRALDCATFDVKRGGIYGFIGENGAGKTTAIRVLTGLSKATSGNFELFGTSQPKEIDEARQKIGAIVENPILYQNKNAMNNMLTQGLLYGKSDRAQMRELLEIVGLGNTGNKKVRNFSLGMRQRLGIALALVNSPELLILDEPTNGLDPMGMVEMRNLLKSLNRDYGITILISSHILAELYQLATDYIIISHGRIIEQLSLEQLQVEAAGRSLEEYYIDLLTENTNGGRKIA